MIANVNLVNLEFARDRGVRARNVIRHCFERWPIGNAVPFPGAVVPRNQGTVRGEQAVAD